MTSIQDGTSFVQITGSNVWMKSELKSRNMFMCRHPAVLSARCSDSQKKKVSPKRGGDEELKARCCFILPFKSVNFNCRRVVILAMSILNRLIVGGKRV